MSSVKTYTYYGCTAFLVFIFGFAGFFKLFPQYMNDPEHDFVREFQRFASIPPIKQLGISPDLYRIGVGILELVCACAMILSPRGSKGQVTVTYVLALVMVGAVYTHVMINDPVGKMSGAIVTSVLIGLRLYSMNRLRVKVD